MRVLLFFGALVLSGCALFSTSGGLTVEKILLRSESAYRELTSDSPPLKKVALQWPLRDMHLTSAFGRRWGARHMGVDLKAPYGTPIYAAAQGVVVYAGDEISGYGVAVILMHGAKIATLYAHASQLLVTEGQGVRRGQPIAYSGESGNASGPHLHFEVRVGTEAVNPWTMISIPRRLSSRHDRTHTSENL